MNKEFQDVLLSKVENGWNQIGIICSDKSNTLLPRDIPIDLPICKVSGVNVKIPFHLWNNYKSIDCDFFPAGVTEIPPFLNVKDVHLRIIPSGGAASVIDLRAFSHLSSLQMNALTVNDITPLKDIPYLSLSTCKEIMDFSVLSTQRELTLFQCPGLTDVSSFRSIRKLSLFCCPNISDISPLKGIYDLTLHGCSNIKDISCLGNHHRLFLSAISSGFDVLLHLPHVSLLNCDIEDVSVLRFAKSVTLNYCIKINSVSSLKTVKKVSLINSGTSGFTDLEGVPDLYLAHKNELRLNDDFIGLLNNRRLTLINNSLSNDITSLSVFSSSIQHLYIANHEIFTTFINDGQGVLLQHLLSLTLDSLKVVKLEGLGHIPTVRIVRCSYLQTMQGLGSNRCVELNNCWSLENVSSLASVPIVTIENCRSVTKTSYECLKNVPRLKIIVC